MHPTPPATAASPLDPAVCRRARLSRDPRFDGAFFLGVSTTGIYCRPVCPARPPAERNVAYFRTAAEAALAGYRPCLRCRPESAPGSPAWLGSSTTVRRALQLIGEGALDGQSVGALAARLGVGERYLRKLFQRELGASPQAIALNQRLLFAKKLLAESGLSITDIAYAAGFGSVRRFNSAVRSHFRLTPGQLRRGAARRTPQEGIRLELQYRPPYDWEGVVGFFRRHAIPGVERVDGDGYERTIVGAGQPATLRVRHRPDRRALVMTIDTPDQRRLMPLVARVRRMFDLDANPDAVHEHLGGDPLLAPLLADCPGLRAPGHWSAWEAAVRAVVGQQVSTDAARSVCARLAAAAAGAIVFPDPDTLRALPPDRFPMPGRRRETLLALAGLADGEELPREQLAAVRGVGPWTIAMAAMRGQGDPDTFPTTDLGLQRAWRALAPPDQSLASRAAAWRPWRSYAANLLWRSLSP